MTRESGWEKSILGPGGRGAKIGHFGAGGVKNVKIGLLV
jgi:hypothetical protein